MRRDDAHVAPGSSRSVTPAGRAPRSGVAVPRQSRPTRTALIAAAIAVASVIGAACSSPGKRPISWSDEPTSRFGPGLIRILDIARTGSGWTAVGSSANPHQAPGVWRSSDLSTWTAVPVAPVSFYGARHELYTIATGSQGAAVVGAAPGGAHDNPRVATWYLDDGTLREVPALFELFGGERQGSVDQIAFGPAGYVIVGDRTDRNNRFGATAWTSPDAHQAFSIDDTDAALESGATETVDALGIAAGPRGYLAVGERFGAPGPTVDGIAWSSPDGRRWTRVTPTAFGGPGDQAIQLAVAWDGGWVVAGTDTSGGDTTIVTWSSRDARQWTETRISHGPGDATAAVTGLEMAGRRIVLAGRIDGRAVLAASTDGRHWRLLGVPASLAPDPHLHLAVAGDDTALIVAATGSGATEVWTSGTRGP